MWRGEGGSVEVRSAGRDTASAGKQVDGLNVENERKKKNQDDFLGMSSQVDVVPLSRRERYQ